MGSLDSYGKVQGIFDKKAEQMILENLKKSGAVLAASSVENQVVSLELVKNFG